MLRSLCAVHYVPSCLPGVFCVSAVGMGEAKAMEALYVSTVFVILVSSMQQKIDR